MDDLDYILGLMAQNTDALGFIPTEGVKRYIMHENYIVQLSPNGKRVGYMLHGVPTSGGVLTVAQHVIECDLRQRGYGMDVVRVLVARAQTANCRAIVLKCAEGLPANAFWMAAGFEHTATLKRANRRARQINVYTLDLWPTLFKADN